jgi:hypothetical protein
MFEDVEESGVDVTPESPDRAIAWAIWSREAAALTHEEAWAILHERYPDEPRFLLLSAYAELSESSKRGDQADSAAFTPAYLLTKIDRILAQSTEALHPRVRELVTFGGAILGAAKADDSERLAAVRAKIGAEPVEPKRDERDRAGIRLRRFEREVLKEIDERTKDDRPLGTRATVAPPSPVNVWAQAVADATKPKKPYTPDVSLQRGDLVEHVKFGVGVVTALEPGKAHILFESGPRKLIAKP